MYLPLLFSWKNLHNSFSSKSTLKVKDDMKDIAEEILVTQ